MVKKFECGQNIFETGDGIGISVLLKREHKKTN